MNKCQNTLNCSWQRALLYALHSMDLCVRSLEKPVKAKIESEAKREEGVT